ncbi:MAG: hypothetical protein WEE89_07075 [Gemmatimonadota bacterium]
MCPRKAASPLLNLPTVNVAVRDISWMTTIAPGIRLVSGQPAPNLLRVPVGDVNRVLKATVRFVADLPKGSSGRVVWQQGESELAVRTDLIRIACATGLVTVTIPVSCDQLSKEETVRVPLAVGTEQRPAGLVMSAFTQPSGPPIVTRVWSEALTAFAWESLIHLAQQLCAAVGNDSTGRALVPGSIGAAANLLLLQPMARHKLTWRP